ncbi:hypothetical protein D6825_02710 [Candidatus Woesearchaeota archaeon]|nr:MAG: hypothetical protein D6825_02710 [Candidatus Woesearchaeota archaeon]
MIKRGWLMLVFLSLFALSVFAARPENCFDTSLQDYGEYSLKEVRDKWDYYSSESSGVCRIYKPEEIYAADCKFKVQLSTPEYGTQGFLCWYDDSNIGVEPAKAKKGGFFSRLLGWFASLVGGSSMKVSEAEARARFIEVFKEGGLSRDAYMFIHPGPVEEGVMIEDGFLGAAVLNEPAYFAWIEPYPDMMYAHPTAYLFIYGDGTLETYEGGAWPIVDGKDLRKFGKRFSSSEAGSGKGSGVSGAFSIEFTGAQVSDGKGPRLRHIPRFASAIPPAATPEKEVEEKECPPGWIRQEVPPGKERGIAMAIASKGDLKIDFEKESQLFLEAAESGGFENAGIFNTIPAASSKIAELDLDKRSSFALFIGAHGAGVWNVKGKVNGESVEFKNMISARPHETKSFGFPQGFEPESISRVGWCFSLGGSACRLFKVSALEVVPSCRKFLVVDSCLSGNLVDESLPGLSIYTATARDTFSWAKTKGGSNNRWFGTFAYEFSKELLKQVPEDPVYPWKDEPKPDFDAAFSKAYQEVIRQVRGKPPLRGYLSFLGLKGKSIQFPQSSSSPVPGDCGLVPKCVPPTGLPPEDPPWTEPGKLTCDEMKRVALNIPDELEDVLKLSDEGFPSKKNATKSEVVSNFIKLFESLKGCYKCPPGELPSWKGCEPYKDAFEILDLLIGGMRSVAQSNFKSDFPDKIVERTKELTSKLNSCTIQCSKRPITGGVKKAIKIGERVEPSGNCESLGIAELFDDRRKCKAACGYGDCDKVPASAVATQTEMKKARVSSNLRCWFCRPKKGESIIGEIGGISIVDGTGSGETGPVGSAGEKEPVDCSKACAERGMSTSKPSSSSILSQLERYRCVSGASIRLSKATVGSCTCYGTPKLFVNQEKPVCKSTPCGDVPCDEQRQCTVGDTKVTVSCTWKGWKELGEYSYSPVVGGS